MRCLIRIYIFTEIHRAMKPEGKLLFAEPRGHVSKRDFDKSVSIAQSATTHRKVDGDSENFKKKSTHR